MYSDTAASSPVLTLRATVSISYRPSCSSAAQSNVFFGPKSMMVRKFDPTARARKRYHKVPGAASCAVAVQVTFVPTVVPSGADDSSATDIALATTGNIESKRTLVDLMVHIHLSGTQSMWRVYTIVL